MAETSLKHVKLRRFNPEKAGGSRSGFVGSIPIDLLSQTCQMYGIYLHENHKNSTNCVGK